MTPDTAPSPLPSISILALTDLALSFREAREDAAGWQTPALDVVLDELQDILTEHDRLLFQEQGYDGDIYDGDLPDAVDIDDHISGEGKYLSGWHPDYSDDDSYNDLSDLDDAYTPGADSIDDGCF